MARRPRRPRLPTSVLVERDVRDDPGRRAGRTCTRSLQALKGHVQEYPGCSGSSVRARVEDEARRLHCYTTWDTPEQLEAFLERGYTFERMLTDIASIEAE